MEDYEIVTKEDLTLEVVTKNEFERTLSEISDSYQILNDDVRYKHTDEILYGITLNKDKANERKFIIFSSISIYNHKFRDYGSDAIRILKWQNSRPIGTSIRVNRTSNWSRNLKKKVLNFDKKFDDSFKN